MEYYNDDYRTNKKRKNDIYKKLFKDVDQELEKLRTEMDKLLTKNPYYSTGSKSTTTSTITDVIEPETEVFESQSQVAVSAFIPAVNKEDIDIEVYLNKIVIKVDVHKPPYYKEIIFNRKIDPDSCKATYKNGVLDIVVDYKK